MEEKSFPQYPLGICLISSMLFKSTKDNLGRVEVNLCEHIMDSSDLLIPLACVIKIIEICPPKSYREINDIHHCIKFKAHRIMAWFTDIMK